jgi:hypothetical protein
MLAGKPASDSNSFETTHFSDIGAFVLGRRVADLGIGPWGESRRSTRLASLSPIVPPDAIVMKGGTSYIFVIDGIEAALGQVREAAARRTFRSTAGRTSRGSS